MVLEITERAALDRIHELQSRVTRLRALGYRIAIDDLGAGYAGLTSFAQLEPEVVKVDMSLVRGIDGSPMKQKLVRSIISLCTELGIQLVAEGIETPAERDALISLGGDLCQGYLFARPGRGYPEPIQLDLTSLAALGERARSTCASVAASAPSLSMTSVATRSFSSVGICASMRASASARREAPRAIARAICVSGEATTTMRPSKSRQRPLSTSSAAS